MEYSQKKIKELVAENYVFASVLYYLGIDYYEYEEDTLQKVCSCKGLQVQQVINELERIRTNEEIANLKLLSFPIDLVISYLKHTHFIFIKKDLPFLVKLVNQLKTKNPVFLPIQQEIKDVFPLFVEDFVHHIYEEEDTLFQHILQLKKIDEKKLNPSSFFYQHANFSMQKFAIEHEVHDDEMKGIRFLMDQYPMEQHTELNTKVLFSELERFEEKLKVHAKIENEVLFPKALMLEKQVRRKFESVIRNN
ncbi:iron-sulfur cluster repair di-iron protein [Marivirga sp. S37H4]|uniref:Iron-sulfur cluster repair di-iron protein n=1 Tax=Marivirga aurantiaca TaxID=2802615 RepID=A0A934WXP4_9BACT|nr:iron-sulfur cluster repair di-iron protein [Marivirga aurantiaca]MBK6264904.1 iron-sulfur cluster repair di-iron protein [Marivirga aurantiaca]